MRRPVVARLDAPWWTAADAAELELAIRELVLAAFVHREKCPTCLTGDRWCPVMGEALDGVLEWRESRILRSKAAFLRASQTLTEFRTEWAA